MNRRAYQLRRIAWQHVTQAQTLYQVACALSPDDRAPHAAALAARGTDAMVAAVTYTMAALNYQAGGLLPQTLEALLRHDVLQERAAAGAGEATASGRTMDVLATLAEGAGASGRTYRATLLHLTRQALVPPSPREAGTAPDPLGTLAGLLATFCGLADVLADDHLWHQWTALMPVHAGGPAGPASHPGGLVSRGMGAGVRRGGCAGRRGDTWPATASPPHQRVRARGRRP